MNVLPAITRELRAQARQPFTFVLRVIGAAAMLIAGFLFVVRYPSMANLGGVVFYYLNVTLYWTIWILVPLSAADCISRERRDGTLGLLFLTPLKPHDIVLAKGLAHGLRTVTLLLAVLPVLTIPILMGGVSWQQAVLAALADFSAACWALAAALVASSSTRSSLRANVGAVLLSLFGLLTSQFVLGSMALGLSTGGTTGGRLAVSVERALQIGLQITASSYNFAGGTSGIAPKIWVMVFQVVAAAAAIAIMALCLAVIVAAQQIRRTWREEPPPVWVQKSQRVFCTPVVALGFFKKWMRWKIERNPIGWLEQRTWTGRVVTWAWFAIVISVYSAAVTDRSFFRGFDGLQLTIGWIMMATIASSAAGSFRRERESGVLELLLVSPLSEEQIINGRLRGLWGQFFPAVAALLGIWIYLLSVFHGRSDKIPFFASTFATLPVIGLYFSLRCRGFIPAFLATLFTGLLFPVMLEWVVATSWTSYVRAFVSSQPSELGAKAILTQWILCGALFFAMRRRLRMRAFPLERTGQ